MITRRMKKTFTVCGAILPLVLLCACETVKRVPQDETVTDPLFSQVEMVDIAILRPQVKASDGRVLSQHAREECRKVLIDKKRYSVPSDGYVDKTLLGRNLAPNQSAGILESDGVIAIRITGWDSGEFIPKGRIYAAGEVVLYGTGRVLWRRSFKDRKCIAPTQVTASNRAQAEGEVVRALVQEILEKLPRKKTR